MTNVTATETGLRPIVEGPLRDGRYHLIIRVLHWLMAIGFVLLWATGVFVTNVEGLPFWIENDRQGVVRDLHKSIGLTLLALLVVRLTVRFVVPPPALPAAIPARERKAAHLGHAALYVTIVIACITGLAIADLQDYGNAYFGIELPKLFPTREAVAGFAVDPWSYAVHGLLAYGLLALVLGHVLFVAIHRRSHNVDLVPRIVALRAGAYGRFFTVASTVAAVAALLIIMFAARAHLTVGPEETPRNYITTTPFGR